MTVTKRSVGRLGITGLLWTVAAVVATVLLVSVLSALPSAADTLRPSASATIAGAYGGWWMMLIVTSAVGGVIGVPIAGALVTMWILVARHVPALEASTRGVLAGTAIIGLAAGVIAYAVLGRDQPHSAGELRALVAASSVIALSVWGGLAVPRLIVERLRPGALL